MIPKCMCIPNVTPNLICSFLSARLQLYPTPIISIVVIVCADDDNYNPCNRSDIVMVETEGGWTAVRSAAVEEQASACQLLLQLIEKTQELMFPFVAEVVKAVAPLVQSPHEDVRSFAFVILPELVRATAKATAMTGDQTHLIAIFSYLFGILVDAVKGEASLDLIMTGLQALKSSIEAACTDWANSTPSAASLTPSSSVHLMSGAQMEALSLMTREVLRDSMQRRAVMRAEARVSGPGLEEEDVEDEALFMSSSLELHFNISELISAVMRTHGAIYMPVFTAHWQEAVEAMLHPNCLREDRQFAVFLICDMLEYGIDDPVKAAEYMVLVVPPLADCCRGKHDAALRQTCCYALGITAERFPQPFEPYYQPSLQALAACVSNGEDEDEARGCCTDNAAASIGIMLERLEQLGAPALKTQLGAMWSQWLEYMPLQHDLEEGRKTIRLLIRCLLSCYPCFSAEASRLNRAVELLVEVLDSSLANTELNSELRRALDSMQDRVRLSYISLPPHCQEKLKHLHHV
jgi:hypothetical protein